MALIELNRIQKVYHIGSRALTVLEDISFSVRSGEFVAIMGPSGSGKSTLMHILGCLDVPTRGTYQLDRVAVSSLSAGALVRIRRASIGFIFQNFHLLPRLTAAQNVELPLVYSGGTGRRQRALAMLARVGLQARAKHRPAELSGGEQQRVAIARALINNPKVLLADEPTGNLDSSTGEEILAHFRTLHMQGTTIILVTHDERLAQQAQRVIRLYDGRLTA